MKTGILFLFLTLAGFTACDTLMNSQDKNSVVYTGDFAGDPIELSIIHIDDSSVKGESRHKGQVSEMSGKRKASEKGYIYHLKELGTSRFEGTFDFELDTSLNLIFGSWQLADTSGQHEAVLYTLKPKLTQ
jgi:hypothetical protein